MRELPAVARVGVDRAEQVSGQRMAVLERARRGIADGSQEFEERGIFPLRRKKERKQRPVKLDAPP